MLILANFTSSWGHDVVALHDLFDGSVAELATRVSFARAPFGGTVLESSLSPRRKHGRYEQQAELDRGVADMIVEFGRV
jgi:hypothetical protein